MATNPDLKKYSRTFFKDMSGSDTSQVPAASASVQVYQQGATVSSPTTVTTDAGGVAVSVYDTGSLTAGNTLQLGTDSSKTMLVVSVGGVTSVTIRSTNGSSIAVVAGDRIVNTASAPTIYSEGSGVATTTNPATCNSRGLVEFYCATVFIDLIVSGSGLTTTLYPSEIAGWAQRAAIAAPSGGATQDAEARTAISSILTALRLTGQIES